MPHTQATKNKHSVETALSERFDLVHARSDVEGWLKQARANAFSAIMSDGVPDRRWERWRHSDVRGALLHAGTSRVAPVPADEGVFDTLSALRVDLRSNAAIVESPEMWGDAGAEIITFGDAARSPSLWLRRWCQPTKDFIENLNLAFATNGVLIRVGAGRTLPQPILITRNSGVGSGLSATRCVVVLERGSSVTIVEEDYAADGPHGLNSDVVYYDLDDGAKLQSVRISSGNEKTHLRRDVVNLRERSQADFLLFDSGGEMCRQDYSFHLMGEEADCSFRAGMLNSGKSHSDLSFRVQHQSPCTRSRVVTKAVVCDWATVSVQGCISVDASALHTDSYQMSKAVLLSPDATVHQKPELEIYADDVKCGHGATVGSLDDTQLFYLRSRGIPIAEAKRILVEGFVAELVDHAPVFTREGLASWVQDRLATMVRVDRE